MPVNSLYKRKIIQRGERWIIESICFRCGFTIYGSVSDQLHEDEQQHADSCSEQVQKPTSWPAP